MGIQDHITCLLRNLYVGQEATIRTEHGTMDWFNWERSMTKLYIVTLFGSFICWVHHPKCWDGWITSWNQDGYRNINNLSYADDGMAESEEELKSLLMKVKEKSEKAGLKLDIKEIMIMVSDPITSWQIGKQWKQWQILFSFAPKSLQMVTAAIKLREVCSLEGKWWQT